MSKTKEKKLTRSSLRKQERDAVKAEEQRKYREETVPYILSSRPHCEKCSTARSGEVHHKKGRGTNNSLLNYEPFLMAVCSPCHRYIHAHPQESYENGWMIKRL